MLGLFGLFAWVYAGLCGRAIYLAGRLPAAEAAQEADTVKWLWIQGAAALVTGTVMLVCGWRLALRADMSDPENQRKALIRF
ncbi:MAG: hypothetical protein JWM59_3868 [Verrucomicrobiales bacterium]|nr:hypothetical protein [Verrucomicrobiales bacterium]